MRRGCAELGPGRWRRWGTREEGDLRDQKRTRIPDLARGVRFSSACETAVEFPAGTFDDTTSQAAIKTSAIFRQPFALLAHACCRTGTVTAGARSRKLSAT